MVPLDPLTQAKALLGRDPARALAAAAAAHAVRPSPQTTLLLATAARRHGDADRAIALLAPLAAAAPRAWGVHHELGIARASLGDHVGAIAALERAIALHPDATGPRHALSDLRMLADEPIDDAPLAAIDDAALGDAATALFDGQAGAHGALLDRFGLDSSDVATACLLAQIAWRSERHEASARLLTAALAVMPGYGPARFRLAAALHRLDRDAEALATIEPLAPTATVRALRGAILMQLGREEAALADLAAVTDRHPDRAPAWLAHGHALRALGRRDEAIHAYRRAIAIDPASSEAWLSIADLKTAALAADDRRAIAILVSDAALPPLARAQAGFALGRATEDAGDHAEAFEHYRAANALRRTIEPYDDDAHRAFVAAIMSTTDAAFFDARAGWGDPDDAPIFVVGMPRSGSTLVEQILASHSQIEGLSELPDLPALARAIPHYPTGMAALSRTAVATLGDAYLGRVRARQRTAAPHIVDKLPGNAFHVALIHLALPNARIIDVRRDARDCCVSLFSQSFAAGQSYSYGLEELGRHYARYVALMDHFDRVLPNRILHIRYEALVDNLETETRRLLDHCGLTFEPTTLRFFDRAGAVRTASSEQVRQPIYRNSVGRWRRFAPWLQPLHDGLAAADVATMMTLK